VSRQEFDLDKVEICVSDGGSTDNLMNLIDRYSEVVTFKYARQDMTKEYIPTIANCPASCFNAAIRWMPSYEYVIKTDPEVLMRDPWVLSEMMQELEKDDTRMYNCRTHFTEGDDWMTDYDEILSKYERHYHYAEGGPFSRSKYYFCSAFSKARFEELRGIDEIFSSGVGYDDDGLRSMWKNRYGQLEKELSGQAIHLWHGPNRYPPPWEEFNRRVYEHIKSLDTANTLSLVNGKIVKKERPWGNPETLSKIYTIKDGSITKTEAPYQGAFEVDLPF
jgi:hypothetical protein